MTSNDDGGLDLPPDALRRIRDDRVAWLATVTPQGVPFPTPVWFVPDGRSLLVFATPSSRKVANVGRHPLVTLHFETDADGDDVVVITGEASVDATVDPATHAAYRRKYGEAMTRISGSVERFAARYSVGVRIAPTRVWVQPG